MKDLRKKIVKKYLKENNLIAVDHDAANSLLRLRDEYFSKRCEVLDALYHKNLDEACDKAWSMDDLDVIFWKTMCELGKSGFYSRD